MNNQINIHCGAADDVIVRHALSESRPEGYPIIEVDDGIGLPVLIFPTRGWLERLARAAVAYLAAHPPEEPDGSADGADIVPAEAVVDADDLLVSMADSYDVRRTAWDFEPTVEEMEVGYKNAPGVCP